MHRCRPARVGRSATSCCTWVRCIAGRPPRLPPRPSKLSDIPGDSLGALPEPADGNRLAAPRRHHAVRHTWSRADPCFEYAAFLADPATPRLLFWARRQAMETTVHRVDAESALGRCTPLAPDIALDGIDEFLTGFLPRSRTPLHADDAALPADRARLQRAAMDRVDQQRHCR